MLVPNLVRQFAETTHGIFCKLERLLAAPSPIAAVAATRICTLQFVLLLRGLSV